MLDEVLKTLEAQETKKAAREKKAKVETLEEALARMAGLKWKDDLYVFEEVRDALLSGQLIRASQAKMKKDDIYQFHKVLVHRKREALKQKVRDSKPDNYVIVQDLATWMKICRAMWQEPIIAIDTETTGLNFLADRIVGISGYFPKADIAWYVPFAHRTGEKQLTEAQVIAPLKEWLEDEDNKAIYHNYKYDGHLLANHGIWNKPYWDTLVCSRLLNEHEDHRLKPLHDKYVAQSGDVVLFEDIIDNADIAGTDVVLAGVYACGDAKKTWDLYVFQKPYIDSVGNLSNIWYNIESKLLPIDVRSERLGVLVDVKRLNEIEAEQLPKIAQAEEDLLDGFSIDAEFLARMSEKFGKDIAVFNFSSNDHLAYLIYDVLNVGGDVPKRFGKKERSTAGEVIDAIIEDVPELKPLKEYRELSKLVNTYAHKIPLAMEKDGRLHSQFDALRTATGRYASSEYGNKGDKRGTNLQNIPGRTALGREIRKCVIPDPGYLFVSSDLSQIEPRIIAHILYAGFGDSSMRDMYIAGVDLYTTMATKVFGLEEKYCVDGAYDPTGTYKPRAVMKTGVLAFLYGQSVKSFAKKMSVTEEVAEKFFEGMRTSFPGLEPFREKVLADLLKYGYVETLFGRKRRWPEYSKDYARLQALDRKPWRTRSDAEQEERKLLWKKVSKAQREAVNCIVQGSAADTLKQIIIKMNELCDERGYKYVFSIHDELMMLLPKQEVTPEAIAAIDDVMTKSVSLTVPLKADPVIQPKWMEETKPKDWDFERGCPKAA